MNSWEQASSGLPGITELKKEIENLLIAAGARELTISEITKMGTISFTHTGRAIRIDFPLPTMIHLRDLIQKSDRAERGNLVEVWQRYRHGRWTAVLVYITAKLNAIREGVTTFDSEFLGNLVTADGQTMGEIMAPALQGATEGFSHEN